MSNHIGDIGVLMAIDPRLKAAIWYMEISLPVQIAHTALNRPACIDSDEILSWGNVTINEIHALIRHDESGFDNVQELAELDAEILTYEKQGVVWTFFYPGAL